METQQEFDQEKACPNIYPTLTYNRATFFEWKCATCGATGKETPRFEPESGGYVIVHHLPLDQAMSELPPKHPLATPVSLRFEPALPCSTQDCQNRATVGNASYDPEWNGWMLFPYCKLCLKTLLQMYESGTITQEEASEQL